MLEEVVEKQQWELSVVDENFIINSTVFQGYQYISMWGKAPPTNAQV